MRTCADFYTVTVVYWERVRRMRIWDRIPPERLCRKHLLGEHRELHGLWNILARIEVAGEDPTTVGYSRHPETLRWVGHMPALRRRHEDLVSEMDRRGYNHASPLLAPDGESDGGESTPDGEPLGGSAEPPPPLDDQEAALQAKGCDCDPP